MQLVMNRKDHKDGAKFAAICELCALCGKKYYKTNSLSKTVISVSVFSPGDFQAPG